MQARPYSIGALAGKDMQDACRFRDLSHAGAKAIALFALGVAGREQELFPAPGLAVASTANVYPEIVNCQSVLGVVDRVVPGLLDRLSVSQARVA